MEITLIIVLNLDDKYIEIIKRRVGIMSIAKFIVNIIAYFIAIPAAIGGIIGLVGAAIAIVVMILLAIGVPVFEPINKVKKLVDYIKRAI